MRVYLAIYSAVATLLVSAPSSANSEKVLPTPGYEQASHSPVSIPPAEKQLPAAEAELWLPISSRTPALAGLDNKILLEGGGFDRDGNLLFVEVFGGRVMRLSPNGTLSVVLPRNAYGSAGIAVHKDGRIFVAGVGDLQHGGSVFAIRPDGSGREIIISRKKGYIPDDLAFDNDGGFYFTDFQGNNAQPTGGVFYVSPDTKTVTPIVTHLSMPNGIALSPDGKVLWVGETGKGLLHRIELSGPRTIALLGTTIPYHFTGARADSIRVDKDGNVYVALIGEGRILVLDSRGVPIGQILIPGRDNGEMLFTTSMAIKPGTSDLYILASDSEGRSAAIFRSRAFAEAAMLFSHK